MEIINFFLSTDISLGLGMFENTCLFIEKFGSIRPGIIFDSNLNNNSYFTKNLEVINKKYPKCVNIINELKGEPTYQYLEQKRSEFERNKPDIIIAIGGGSTMDLGKGVALLLNNDVSALSLKGFPENINNPLPLITIPTIFGSGSEVSYNAVFIDDDEGRKLGINSQKNFPAKTIIDPLLTMSAPNSAVISSAMDSLVHCVDSFGSVKSTPLSKMFSIEGFKNTINFLLKKDINDPVSRIDLAIGSLCGTTALMNSGDGPTNGFAYYFGVKDKIPHGLAGGIFLKEVMKWNLNNGYKEYHQLLFEDRYDIEEKNKKLFSELESLYTKHKIPVLKDYGYLKGDINNLAKSVSKALQGSFSGNPIPFNTSSAEQVLSNLL
jgi:alcohol dehydrogenase